MRMENIQPGQVARAISMPGLIVMGVDGVKHNDGSRVYAVVIHGGGHYPMGTPWSNGYTRIELVNFQFDGVEP